MPQFVLKLEDIDGERFTLRGPEAFHVTRVLRRKEGSEIELFDGKGGKYTGIGGGGIDRGFHIRLKAGHDEGKDDAHFENGKKIVHAIPLAQADAMHKREDQHHRRGRGGGRDAGDNFLYVHAEQQRDERRRAYEGEQETQHAAQVTGGVAV